MSLPDVRHSLYPTKGSLQEVRDVGRAQLPITSENQLSVLLELHKNTLLNLVKEIACPNKK